LERKTTSRPIGFGPENLRNVFGHCGKKSHAFYAEKVGKHEPLLTKRKCGNRNIDVRIPTKDLAFG